MSSITIIALIWCAVMSVTAFILYAADKAKAKSKKWRTPEKTLLLCGVFGGAAGALLGMKICRHKTKHWYFWAVNLLALGAHIAAIVFLFLKT